jgi:hypothetical protein
MNNQNDIIFAGMHNLKENIMRESADYYRIFPIPVSVIYSFRFYAQSIETLLSTII